MMIKYRIHEVAKDLCVASKDIIQLLTQHMAAPKNSQAVLSEEELNLIFEYYTQKHRVENFNGFFADGDSDETAVIDLSKQKEPEPEETETAEQNEDIAPLTEAKTEEK